MALQLEEKTENSGLVATLNIGFVGIEVNDIMFIYAGSNTSVQPSISVGVDWTPMVSQNNTFFARLDGWYKVATLPGPELVTFDWGGAVNAVGFGIRLSGVDPADPIGNDGGASTGSGFNPATNLASPTSPQGGKVAAAVGGAATVFSDVSAGYSLEVAVQSGASGGGVAHELLNPNINLCQFTGSISTSWVAHNIGVNALADDDNTAVLRRRREGY